METDELEPEFPIFVEEGKNEFTLSVRGFLSPIEARLLLDRIGIFDVESDSSEELVVFYEGEEFDLRTKITKHDVEFLVFDQGESKEGKVKHSVRLGIEYAETLTRLLGVIGHREGKLSASTRLEWRGEFGRLTHKFGPMSDDFWTLRKTCTAGTDRNRAVEEFRRHVDVLGLIPWTDSDYIARSDEKLRSVGVEPTIRKNDDVHPQIVDMMKRYPHVGGGLAERRDLSIEDAMKVRSNDFTDLERLFLSKRQHNLLAMDVIPYETKFRQTASIVIPFRGNVEILKRCIVSIARQNLSSDELERIEVILVNDGSDEWMLDDAVKSLVAPITEVGMQANYIRTMRNLGRASARNLGIRVATGDVLMLFDSDVVLPSDYIREVMIRHETLHNIVLVGFKENVEVGDLRVVQDRLENERVEMTKDFRHETTVGPSYSGVHKVRRSTTVRCLESTSNFKHFGMGRSVGIYDLAGMVVTHNVSVRREHVMGFGGFAPHFGTLWGFEDTFFGACLIAAGCYVVPLTSVGVFHLVEKDERKSGVRDEKTKDLEGSLSIYRELIKRPLPDVAKSKPL